MLCSIEVRSSPPEQEFNPTEFILIKHRRLLLKLSTIHTSCSVYIEINNMSQQLTKIQSPILHLSI